MSELPYNKQNYLMDLREVAVEHGVKSNVVN